MARKSNEPSHGSLVAFLGVIRHLAPHLRSQWKLLMGGFLALGVETGVALLEPWPLKFILDHLYDPQAAVPRPLADLAADQLLIVMAAAIVVLALLRALGAFCSELALTVAASRITANIRAAVFRHVQRLSLSFHTKARGGDLTTRLISDTSRLQDVSVSALAPLARNVLTLFGMIAIMAWLNWQMTLVAAITLPVLVAVTSKYSAAIQRAARTARDKEGAMASTAAESLTAIKVVQSLSLEDRLDTTFDGQNAAGLETSIRSAKLEASLERMVQVVIAVGMAGVLWYGGKLVLTGQLTPGELVVFSSYLKSGFKPIRDLAKYSSRIAKATASGERIVSILSTEPAIVDAPTAVPATPFHGRITFDKVSFCYEPGQPIIRDASFTINPGEHVAVIGPSGGGKSTLVSLLLRLYDPAEGAVLIDGVDLRDMTISSVRAQMGVVLQDGLLFAMSARDNIAMGGTDVTEEQVVAAARLANAEEFIRTLPQGFDTVLGERGATLSGGQRQRISIARAAVRNAPIVLLDEPTTGLDKANREEVMTALRSLCRGRTTFMVVHDQDLAEAADRVLQVEDGRVRELPQKLGRALPMEEAAGRPPATVQGRGLHASTV